MPCIALSDPALAGEEPLTDSEQLGLALAALRKIKRRAKEAGGNWYGDEAMLALAIIHTLDAPAEPPAEAYARFAAKARRRIRAVVRREVYSRHLRSCPGLIGEVAAAFFEVLGLPVPDNIREPDEPDAEPALLSA